MFEDGHVQVLSRGFELNNLHADARRTFSNMFADLVGFHLSVNKDRLLFASLLKSLQNICVQARITALEEEHQLTARLIKRGFRNSIAEEVNGLMKSSAVSSLMDANAGWITTASSGRVTTPHSSRRVQAQHDIEKLEQFNARSFQLVHGHQFSVEELYMAMMTISRTHCGQDDDNILECLEALGTDEAHRESLHASKTEEESDSDSNRSEWTRALSVETQSRRTRASTRVQSDRWTRRL
jgi:hypothetical protein